MRPNPAFYGGDGSEPLFLDTCEGGCGRTFNVRAPDGSIAVPSLDVAETCIDCAGGGPTRSRSPLQMQRRAETRARDLEGILHHQGRRVCASSKCRKPFRPKGREACCSPECTRERRRETVKAYDQNRRAAERRGPRKVPALKEGGTR